MSSTFFDKFFPSKNVSDPQKQMMAHEPREGWDDDPIKTAVTYREAQPIEMKEISRSKMAHEPHIIGKKIPYVHNANNSRDGFANIAKDGKTAPLSSSQFFKAYGFYPDKAEVLDK